MLRTFVAACGLALLAVPVTAAEKETLELKLVGKTATYPWPYGQSQKEFEAALEELKIKRKMGEKLIWPAPPTVDQVLRITNTGKDKVEIYVDGDPNVITLRLNGPSVMSIQPGYTFTAEFRLPKGVMLEPGKSHEVPVKWLADGFRNGSRYFYPTAPGEYKLSATFQLGTAEGGKGSVLKSDEIKFTIEEPKK